MEPGLQFAFTKVNQSSKYLGCWMACQSQTRESRLQTVVGVGVVGPLPLKAAKSVSRGTNRRCTHWVLVSPKKNIGQERLGRVASGRRTLFHAWQADRLSGSVGDSVSPEMVSPEIEPERFAPRGPPHAHLA
jgi:hypothetical protein